ncbi:MAG: hypothetical protein OXC07_07860 [Kistimonas sp.]|nr:hypothetical protein [Kistimonas sp.]
MLLPSGCPDMPPGSNGQGWRNSRSWPHRWAARRTCRRNAVPASGPGAGLGCGSLAIAWAARRLLNDTRHFALP